MKNESKFYLANIIILLLNAMNKWGWISIPWSVLMIPSIAILLVWLYVVIVAILLIKKYPDRYR